MRQFVKKEDGMKYMLRLCILFSLLFPVTAPAQETELKDSPHFSRMPNYSLVEATDFEFTEYRFFNGKNLTTVEGEKHFRVYTLKEGAKQSSELQIARNYAAAIKSMGGTVVFDGTCPNIEGTEYGGYRMLVGKVVKGGGELWLEIAITNEGYDYYLTDLRTTAMKQDVTANDMFEALNRDGHVALYINFDTGKSTIKAESQQIIGQIVEMLKSNVNLQLSVEGHTDNVGNAKSNQTLSEQRAKAVVAAITAQGIAVERLSSLGYGQEKPIADNKNEEGRAKNRRVELVKK